MKHLTKALIGAGLAATALISVAAPANATTPTAATPETEATNTWSEPFALAFKIDFDINTSGQVGRYGLLTYWGRQTPTFLLADDALREAQKPENLLQYDTVTKQIRYANTPDTCLGGYISSSIGADARVVYPGTCASGGDAVPDAQIFLPKGDGGFSMASEPTMQLNGGTVDSAPYYFTAAFTNKGPASEVVGGYAPDRTTTPTPAKQKD